LIPPIKEIELPDLIDIGINLAHAQFDSDRDIVIERAQRNGVTKMVITGTSVRASMNALALAKKRPGMLYATAGVHPHDAKTCNDRTMLQLRDLQLDPAVVAVGECGLDYNRDFSPRPIQNQWFENQVKLACEIKKPLFLHERDASTKFIEILKHYHEQLPKTVVHCFTGTEEELEQYISLGFYIGITGWICDERRGTHLHSMIRKIPLNRLMLETDAPFLLPRNMPRQTKNSTRNEPGFLPYVAKKVAECLGKTISEVSNATTANAKEFFGI